MDMCVGSMLDYLQDSILSDAKLDMSRIMFETAYGLAYLHEKEIIHGCLTLRKVLLWMEKDDSDSKPIVKITDYYTHLGKNKVINHIILYPLLKTIFSWFYTCVFAENECLEM